MEDSNLNAQINDLIEKQIETKRRMLQQLNNKFDYKEYYYYNQDTSQFRKKLMKNRVKKTVQTSK